MNDRSKLVLAVAQIQRAQAAQDADSAHRLLALGCALVLRVALGHPPDPSEIDDAVLAFSDLDQPTECKHPLKETIDDPCGKEQTVEICVWCAEVFETTPWVEEPPAVTQVAPAEGGTPP